MEVSSGQPIIDVYLPTYQTDPKENERFLKYYKLFSVTTTEL